MKQEPEKNKPFITGNNPIWNIKVRVVSASTFYHQIEEKVKNWKLRIVLN